MGKIGAYEAPTQKYRNYSLPTSKPLRSHAFYEEKVWTLQEQIYNKVKKVSEFLEDLYPRLTDNFSPNIKSVIQKNLEILLKDLDLMQQDLHKNPESFNTNKLTTNHQRIAEMKNVCDTLQTVRTYEYEFRNLNKIKHALNELEHLIQPTSFEKRLEKAEGSAKKEGIPTVTKKKIKEKSKAKPAAKSKPKAKPKAKSAAKPKAKKQAVVSKKAKPATKAPQQKKSEVKQPKKSKSAVPKLKQSEKKATKPKLPSKSIVKTKPKSKTTKSAKQKKK